MSSHENAIVLSRPHLLLFSAICPAQSICLVAPDDIEPLSSFHPAAPEWMVLLTRGSLPALHASFHYCQRLHAFSLSVNYYTCLYASIQTPQQGRLLRATTQDITQWGEMDRLSLVKPQGMAAIPPTAGPLRIQPCRHKLH